MKNQNVAFMTIFMPLEDPRIDRNKLYPLIEILLVAFATILSGGEGYNDMHEFGNSKLEFFKTILPFKNGIPSEDTFERVFTLLDPKQFEQCFNEWIEHIKTVEGIEILSIDGKTIRRSGSAKSRPLHVVNVWAGRNRLILGCHAVDEKSNEITAIPEILKLFSLKGTTTTMDAMGCQKHIAQQIVDGGGDFVIALKENQPVLHEEVKVYFEETLKDKNDNTISYYETLEKDHGRIDKRRYGLCTDIKWLIKRNPGWPIRSIGFVQSKRIVNGKESIEIRYYIATLKEVRSFGEAVRAHWGVENSAHCVLDITFNEDQSRVRDRNAAQNLAIMRRLAMNTLEKDKTPKRSKRRKRLKAGWDDQYLKNLLTKQL